MPRGKRRTAAEMAAATTAASQNTTEEETTIRQPSKRSRASGPGSRRVGPARNDDHFQLARCIGWFTRYTTIEEPDTLGPDGMERFCEDINVEPENVAMLVLAYRMGARQMGYFTQAEWVKGLTELQCDTPAKLQAKLDLVRNSLNDFTTFKAVYRYAYDFARDKDQRSMDIETARAMLQLLLARHWPLFAQFSQFLEQSKYKVINKDQWCNILEFSRTITNDLTNYDIDGAWPVLLDEFVEWMRMIRETPETLS